MDGQRFDELARFLGTGRSRRQTLKFVLASLGAAAVGFRRTIDASAGVCRPETSPCVESSDCCEPAVCTFGACYPAGGCLSEGEQCQSDEDCCGFLRCDGTCGQACSFESEECSSSDDCCGVLVCDGGACEYCAESGQSCGGSIGCCSGLSCSSASETCVAAPTADHATITIHKATCPADTGSDIFEQCHDNALSGVGFDIYINGFEIGLVTVTTDADGVASHTILEAAAEGNVTIAEHVGDFERYVGVHVFCSEQNSGTVLYDDKAPEGWITIHAVQGDDVVCDWYNLTEESSEPQPTAVPTATAGGVTTLPSTGNAAGGDGDAVWIGAALVGGAAALIAGKRLNTGKRVDQ
jgi:hypothetical protein